MKTIGVLALQGAFKEHVQRVEALGHRAIEVRTLAELQQVDGLILPGGESTAMGKLLDDFQMKAPLAEKIAAGLPTWGTCAGMILMAKSLENDDRRHLAVMDIAVRRNAYGAQLGSFDVTEPVKGVSDDPIPLVFIRAPYIVAAGPSVEVVHEVRGNIVAAREGHMFVTSFHPELSEDLSFHRYFIEELVG